MIDLFIRNRRRVLALSLGLLLLLVTRLTGLTEMLDVHSLKALMVSTGPAGVLAFAGAFTLGNMVGVPGLVFIIASLVVYGQGLGAGVALGAAMASVTINFFVIRLIGGKGSPPTGKLARKLLGGLERHPVRTVFLLRNLLITSPPLNYALALSSIQARDYLLGSALGLIGPIVVYALFLDQLIRWGFVSV